MSSARVLELVDLFSDLDPRQLEQIFRICETVKFQKDDVIFEHNSSNNDFYIILEGKVEIQTHRDSVSTRASDGRQKPVAVLFRGQSFGEVALVDQGLRAANAVCSSETCTLLRIRREDFMKMLQDDLEMGFIVMSNLASDLCVKIRQNHDLIQEALLYGLKLA